MPAVGIIGAFDALYPRNQIIRAGLPAHGWQVHAAPLDKRLPTARKLPLLWRSMRRLAPECDRFILAEFNQLLAPFAVIAGRALRRPVLVDYMVGLYDSAVQDRAATAPHSKRARLFRAIDRWNIATAPAIFTDTDAHRAAMRTIVGRAAERLAVVPVGAYDEWWSLQPVPGRAPGEPLRVQFFGSFIPFHGVDVILAAARRLADDERFRFEIIGRGQTYEAVLAAARPQDLPHVTLVDSVPPPDLPGRVAAADVCLGVFGARAKTDYVVPNKVYQCLAIGRPVVTATATAISEHFTPGKHLLTVPPGDPAALADALRRLADDPAERARLGAAAAARISADYTPVEVVKPLLVLLDRAG